MYNVRVPQLQILICVLSFTYEANSSTSLNKIHGTCTLCTVDALLTNTHVQTALLYNV